MIDCARLAAGEPRPSCLVPVTHHLSHVFQIIYLEAGLCCSLVVHAADQALQYFQSFRDLEADKQKPH
jgi:hypothetical protein